MKKCPDLGPDPGIYVVCEMSLSASIRRSYVRSLCINLCCMSSVSKTSLCPLLLLFPWHCYPLTSSKAMVCTNTNCYATPSPPLSLHTYTLSAEAEESDNNTTEDTNLTKREKHTIKWIWTQSLDFLLFFSGVSSHFLPFSVAIWLKCLLNCCVVFLPGRWSILLAFQSNQVIHNLLFCISLWWAHFSYTNGKNRNAALLNL